MRLLKDIIFVAILCSLSRPGFAQEVAAAPSTAAATNPQIESRTEARAAEKPTSTTAATSDSTTTKSATRKSTPVARATAVTAATTPPPEPQVKKLGFFQRLFGRRPKPPKATPAPAATPITAATQIPKKRGAGATGPTRTGAPRSAPAATGSAPKSKAASEHVAGGSDARAKKQPVGAGNPSTETLDPETVEKQKYTEAKAKALADPDVKDLKVKADGAADDEAGHKALRAYNKALFSKMRQIDPSIKERVDQMETAILKQLDEKQ